MTEISAPTSLIFFDGTNFDRRLYEAYGRTDIDHAKLFAEIAAGTRLVGIHYFYAMLIQHDDRVRYSAQRRAVSVIRAIPGAVMHEGQHRKREARCPRCKCVYNYFAEKGTDVNLSAQLILAACRKAADRLIVVSSDNDFAQAIGVARAQGVEVDVAFLIDPNQHEHTQLLRLDGLRRAGRRYTRIDQDMIYRCWSAEKSA
jgi:NYN domain